MGGGGGVPILFCMGAGIFLNLNRDMFKPFRSHRDLLGRSSGRVREGLAQVLKGFPSEKRIYESTLVGQAKLFS